MDFKNTCKNCPNNSHCCIFNKQSGFTFLTIKDAKRIKKQTKKEYSEFLDYSPLSKKVLNYLKNDDPANEGTLRLSQLDKNRILRLKTKNNGKCIFLNDQNRCEIYDIRPNICRIYPFWAIKLINGKLKVIEHDINSKCKIIKSLKKKDIDNILSKNEQTKIKKLFKDIINENSSYKKNIRKFIKKIKK